MYVCTYVHVCNNETKIIIMIGLIIIIMMIF